MAASSASSATLPGSPPRAPISLVSGIRHNGAGQNGDDNGGDIEEACTAPLLLNNSERTIAQEVNEHNATMEQEHRQFKVEAREIRRVRQRYCLLSTLVFLSFLPTLVLVTAFSPLALAICIAVFVRQSNRISKVPPLIAFLPFLLVNICAIYFYDAMFGYDSILTASLVLAVAGSVGFYYWHQQQQLQEQQGGIISEEQEHSFRKKQLFFAYLKTVQSVAQSVQNGGKGRSNSEAGTELREFHPPVEGFYKGSTVVPKKKRNNNNTPSPTPGQGDNSNKESSSSTEIKPDESQLFLLFPRADNCTGWWIRGARKRLDGTVQTVVVEGFVSPSHDAYWTEGSLDGTENTLFYGKFDGQFQGEWLSFTENQSHPYALPLITAADTLQHLGLECTECRRNPHPGKCFTNKAGAVHYCETCVMNNPGLCVEGGDFVELSLPEVNPRSDGRQAYNPPAASSD